MLSYMENMIINGLPYNASWLNTKTIWLKTINIAEILERYNSLEGETIKDILNKGKEVVQLLYTSLTSAEISKSIDLVFTIQNIESWKLEDFNDIENLKILWGAAFRNYLYLWLLYGYLDES